MLNGFKDHDQLQEMLNQVQWFSFILYFLMSYVFVNKPYFSSLCKVYR